MSAVATGVVISALSAGYGVSTTHQAKKTQKHVKKRTAGRASELAAKELQDKETAKVGALKEKRQRLIGVGRNVNLFGGSMNDAATRAKKMLTGQ